MCIRYKHRHVRPEGLTGRGAASRIVTLVVQVHRASGLQAAARYSYHLIHLDSSSRLIYGSNNSVWYLYGGHRVLSEQDERFRYFAATGVNAYVTVQLSFCSETERRCTRVAARTFCPEFDHHTEVSRELQIQHSGGETCSLAEQLEEAFAVFTVWNKDNRQGFLEPVATYLRNTIN